MSYSIVSGAWSEKRAAVKISAFATSSRFPASRSGNRFDKILAQRSSTKPHSTRY
jgi:hypothetical protein